MHKENLSFKYIQVPTKFKSKTFSQLHITASNHTEDQGITRNTGTLKHPHKLHTPTRPIQVQVSHIACTWFSSLSCSIVQPATFQQTHN